MRYLCQTAFHFGQSRHMANSSDLTPHVSGVGRTVYSRMNDRLGYFLATLIILIAVPQASNPAVWWLAFGTIIAVAASWHLLRGAQLAPCRPLQLAHHKALFLVLLPVPIVALVQSAPIAWVLPAALTWLPEELAEPLSISLLPSASYFGALRVLIYMAFFALILEVAGQDARAEKVGWFLFFGIAAHACWALVALNMLGDVAPWGPKTAYQGFATGTFVNRNSFATFLGLGLVLGLVLTIERARKLRMRHLNSRTLISSENIEIALLLGVCLLIAMTLFATASRLGIFATLVAVLVSTLALRLKSDASRVRVALEALALTVVLGAIGMLGGGVGMIDRAIFVAGDAESRFGIYRSAFEMIAARPWMGWGWDNFAPAFEVMRLPGLDTRHVFELAHSTYLTHWVELGLIFGSLVIVAGAMLGLTLLQRFARRRENLAMPSAALGALVLGALHSTLDFSLEIPANMFLFLAILGLGAGHRRRVQPPTQTNAEIGPAP